MTSKRAIENEAAPKTRFRADFAQVLEESACLLLIAGLAWVFGLKAIAS